MGASCNSGYAAGMRTQHAGGVAGLLAASCLTFVAAESILAQRSPERLCEVMTPLTQVPGLREGSGLALSRRAPTRLFTINDSGPAEIFVLGLDGTVRSRVRVAGASVTDWEDVTTGPCPGGTCLYLSDIGDNNARRAMISVYRMREPAEDAREVVAERLDAVYADGPRDAEAVFADADGRLYLLTKEARVAGLYAFPARLTPGARHRLERMATIDFGTGRGRFARITDAESSADGSRVAVRTNDALFILPTHSLLAGRMADATVFSLRALGEPQGEGVAIGSGAQVFLVGEGGGGRRTDGTFIRLSCAIR